MQLFMGERDPLHIHYHGTENLYNLFETDFLLLLREVKRQLRIVVCKKSPSLCNHESFTKLQFTDTSSAGKTARKLTKMPQSFGF